MVGAKYLKLNVFFVFLFTAFLAFPSKAESDSGEVSGILVPEEMKDADSELFEELKQAQAKDLEESFASAYEEDAIPKLYPQNNGKIFKKKGEAPRAVSLYPQVFVEVFKVKTDSRGNVTGSILGVTDEQGEEKEIILVTLDGHLTHAWATSTAQSYKKREHKTRGWIYPSTPEGTGFKPHSLYRYHSSSVYGDGKTVNMPYAIFFNGGVALHGTTPDHYRELGEKDSGACARMYQPDASKLWNYVNPEGYTSIYSSKNADVLSEIRSRVTINVYGFDKRDGVDRTSPELRASLRVKYEGSLAWIQAQVRDDLKRIKNRN